MFKKLNPLLHSELRLAVMSILIGVEEADFVYIKKLTGATAGNLSVQLDKLSEAGYVSVSKGFKGKKPCTTCAITEIGRNAFTEYVDALRDYLHSDSISAMTASISPMADPRNESSDISSTDFRKKKASGVE